MTADNYPPDNAAGQPDNASPTYRSTQKRAPSIPPVVVPATLGELSKPLFGHNNLTENDSDLTRQHNAKPQGERIIVAGRLLDDGLRPASGYLIEIWQTNAAGRYIHAADQHDAPLDPNFTGAGRTVTDADGWYRFTTVKPGAYPWGNHTNAWRPAHIHFSLFGPSFLSRLVTQMYFPADPLLALDPILQSVADATERARLISILDFDLTQPGWALGYRFDITLRGNNQTPTES
ncbi:MAG TPA: protocatechuate 3,4-dioxygenase subunit beta [Alphaproteobacteria bacterium]|nr:protocatechuate 3,4-dioxygenase subunit beta [Alphaproteobacteria bacterium]